MADHSELAEFDPFEAFPYLKRLKNWSSWTFVALWPVVITVLLIVCYLDGTLGTGSDLRPIDDVATAIGIRKGPSSSDFPLLRDFTNLYLVTVICLTVPLLHWQWRCMRRVMPKLLESRVLVPKEEPEYSRLHQILGIQRALRNSKGDPITTLMDRLATTLRLIARGSILIPVISLAVALFVALGQYNSGVFLAYSGEIGSVHRDDWIRVTYDSWWASIGHPAEFLIYYFLLALGVFLVIAQCSVGLISVWALLAFSAVAGFDLEWTDRDGNFGWQSVSDTYRTVALSLTLHGTALSFSLIALGEQGFFWGFAMVAVWIVMLPSVTLGPFLALRSISHEAQGRRIQFTAPTTRAEVAEIRSSIARPLRIARVQLSAVVVAVVLPIALTAAQIYFTNGK